ncbi:MAG: hypothetical protein EG825_07335 [Rhodocyclaceae bacterium]|nr:hypothetical protein [Rhodocyclaceae bacterium]
MNTAATTRIDEIAADLRSIKVILGFALVMLESSENYGVTDSQDGEMLCDVGQVLTDSIRRLGMYSEELTWGEVNPKNSEGGAA